MSEICEDCKYYEDTRVACLNVISFLDPNKLGLSEIKMIQIMYELAIIVKHCNNILEGLRSDHKDR